MAQDAFPERELIPYEASTFTAGRAAVLAAHPDDEVLGCGAAIASLRQAGSEVHVLLLTDGAGWEREAATRTRIAEERRAESRRALEALGGAVVATASIPDREVGARRAETAAELRRFLGGVRPDLVFVPSPVEIHPDHRALAEVFLELARRGAVGDPLVAFYELSQPIRPNHLLDATPYLARKDAAMAAYVSQNASRDYPAFIRGLNAYRRMTLGPEVEAAEGYYVVPAADLRRTRLSTLSRAMGPCPDRPRRALASLAASLVGG